MNAPCVGLGTRRWGESMDDAVIDRIIRSVEGVPVLIDSAPDWGFGTTEPRVGHVLRGRRGQFQLASKAGRLPLERGAIAHERRYIETTYIAPGLCRAEEILPGRRCFSPQWITRSLRCSLESLGVDTIDIVLLQEPEWLRTGIRPWRAALASTFEALEEARAAGRIRSYGVSCFWGILGGPTHDLRLDLPEVARIATSVGGPEHGCRFVQFPISPLRPAGATERAVAEAREHGLRVIGVAPFDHGRLLAAMDSRGVIEEEGRLWTLAQWLIQAARCLGADCCVFGTVSPEHAAEDIEVVAHPPFRRNVLDKVMQ